MKTPIDFELIDRYLSGEATLAERREVEDLAARDADVNALLARLRTAGGSAAWNTDAAWTRLSAAMAQPAEGAKETTPAPARRAFSRNPWRIVRVAAALAAVGLGLLIVWQRIGPPAILPAFDEYTASPRSPREITLPDGSAVTLGPSSKLIAWNSSTGPRSVRLEGEAFFEVVPDTTRPFTVQTATSRTTVVGTSFNVRAQGVSPVEVVVATGRVRLQGINSQTQELLTPGKLGRLETSGAITVEDVRVDDYIAWTKGRLIFRNASFADASRQLERWYAVTIQIPDAALAQSRLTASFEGQSIDEVDSLIAETLGARYQKNGNTLTFTKD